MRIDPVVTGQRGSAEAAAPSPRTAPAPAPANVEPPPSETALQAAVAQINQVLRAHHSSLQFEIDEPSGKTVVRVIDEDTKEVVRQFPSEEVLAIARAIPPISGALLKDTA